MTQLEVRLFAELSKKELSDRCSDYTMPNDDEHWAIEVGARAWNVHKTVEQYLADVDDIEYVERPEDDTIYTADFLILGYLQRKAIKELAEAAT